MNERIWCNSTTTLGHTPDRVLALLSNLGCDVGVPTSGTECVVTRERRERRL